MWPGSRLRSAVVVSPASLRRSSLPPIRRVRTGAGARACTDTRAATGTGRSRCLGAATREGAG
ncbi:hypothetical protein ACFPRL_08400 [Pseudoclavibacter helvolus]